MARSQHVAEGKPDGFEFRLSLLFATLLVPSAVHLAFFPLWLRDRGFSSVEIATLLAAPVLVRIFATPPVTFYADRSPERAYVMIAITALSVLVSFFFEHESGIFGAVCPCLSLVSILVATGAAR